MEQKHVSIEEIQEKFIDKQCRFIDKLIRIINRLQKENYILQFGELPKRPSKCNLKLVR